MAYNNRYNLVRVTALFIALFFSSYVFASDPGPLFWMVIFALVGIGALLFGLSLFLVSRFIRSRLLRAGLYGFFFGLFLGPVYLPSDGFMPNLGNLFTGIGGSGVVSAMYYTLCYSALFLIVCLVKAKLKF